MSDLPPFCVLCAPPADGKRLACSTVCNCDCHWCACCDLERTRRLNHLCAACNAYQAAMGQLPSARVRRRRLDRRELERLERLAWGA